MWTTGFRKRPNLFAADILLQPASVFFRLHFSCRIRPCHGNEWAPFTSLIGDFDIQ
jgi:hypothetical protein